jgi:OOP family OmpA-OmpF porin
MLLRKTVLLVGLVAAVSTVAQAVPEEGVYAGATIGYGSTDYTPKNQNLNPVDSYDVDGFAWNLLAGYQLNPYLALEGDYTQFASMQFSGVNGIAHANTAATEHALGAVGKLMYPFGHGFNAFGTLGLDYVWLNRSENNTADANGVGDSNSTSIRPTFGLGAGYEFYPGWVAQASWSHITSGGGIESSDYWGVGATYHFG